MEEKTYVKLVAKYYECNACLASKIIKSAELNGSKRELDRIVQMQEQKKG